MHIMHTLLLQLIYFRLEEVQEKKYPSGQLKRLQRTSHIICDNNGQMPIQILTHVHDSVEHMSLSPKVSGHHKYFKKSPNRLEIHMTNNLLKIYKLVRLADHQEANSDKIIYKELMVGRFPERERSFLFCEDGQAGETLGQHAPRQGKRCASERSVFRRRRKTHRHVP